MADLTNLDQIPIDELLDEIHGNEDKISRQKDYKLLTEWVRKRLWHIGSKVEVYSKSSNRWFKGDIIGIVNDSEGEWLEVQYSVNGTFRRKQTPRDDLDAIRPFSKALTVYKYIHDAIHTKQNPTKHLRYAEPDTSRIQSL